MLLLAFSYESLRGAAPLLNLTLFRDRSYSAVTVTSLMVAAAMFSALVVTPFYFLIVRGEDATHTALLVAPVAQTPAGAALAFQHTFWWLTAISAAALVPAVWLLRIERRMGLRELEKPSAAEVVLEAEAV